MAAWKIWRASKCTSKYTPCCHVLCRWLAEHLDVGAPAEVNLFETTIRILGGLLSAQVRRWEACIVINLIWSSLAISFASCEACCRPR